MTLLTVLYFILSLGFVFFLTLPFFNVLLSRGVREQLFVPKNKKDCDFGIVITAYKNVEIAKGLVHSLLNQTAGIFRIYLIADHCDVSKWDIRHELLDVLRPAEPLNLKAKSIIYGMENFRRPHDYTIVFDADNLAHPDFLKVINSYANAGLRAIQGQRTAKNLDTVYACADATGEFYKNYIERYVPWLLGSSAVISGSGMAVETDLYAAYLRSPEIEQGKHLWKKMLQEDKILQNFLLRRDERIAYARDAIVFDEKVSTGRDVETQRSRWLYSYFQNMKNAVGILRRGVVNRSWNQFLFGLITLAPPMFIQLFGGLALAVIGVFVLPPMAVVLGVSVALFLANIFWVLYLSRVPAPIWKAIWGLPLFVVKQIFALFKMRDPNKNFKHTEHKVNVTIDEILK